MPGEIERTFLVTDDRWRGHTTDGGSHLVQGYLHVDESSSIRVRLRGEDEAVLTVKRGSGMTRSEAEVPLPRASAQRLLDEAALGGAIHKRRHEVPLERDLVAEVDEFGGHLDGLVLVEVELPSRDTSLPQVDWFGEEVTGDARWTNARLATEGRPA